MRCPRISLASGLGVALAAVFCSSASAQSYGPGEEVLTIGAAEFQSTSPGATGYIDSDGYLYDNGVLISLAPLPLPEGALIEKFCLYANDSATGFVEAFLIAGKLVPGGESPTFLDVVGAGVFSSGSDIGYGYSCSKPFSYRLRSHIDLDGDGTLDAVAYYVRLDLIPGSQDPVGLGGVQITWKRQVSAPPSEPTFGDVPASDPAFPFVEALVASGITAGCAGGNYCPDANLTRRQMAVFLAKALGLHWAD